MMDCRGCRYYHNLADTHCFVCDGSGYTRPSNADRLRAMTDEELAKFFERILDCESCFLFKNECGRDGYSCNQRITEWLKQEVQE